VSARGSVDEEPAALGAPGIGRQVLGPLERGRLGPDVYPVDAGWEVVQDRLLAQGGDQGRIGSRALVAGNVEAAGIARDVGDDRVEVGSLGLVSHRYAPCGGSPPAYREYGYHHSFGATSLSMWTCFVSWKASRPSRPSSLPRPDCLKPPKGPASLSVSGSLNQTVPAFTSRMQRRIVLKSWV